jgi:pimeloyl-ACP methyl ester carboxylesterase
VGTVVLAHGFAQNRCIGAIGLPLARLLHDLHWNTLLFDFRGSGDSGGKMVTLGQGETHDLLGAFDFARAQGGGPVALAGFSMGATTALLAAQREGGVAGVLADSPFAALGAYLRRDLGKWTHLPRALNAVILCLAPGVTGIAPDRVDARAGMPALAGRPVLLIAGADDELVPPRYNAESLVEAAPPGAVRYWRVAGAGHLGAWEAERGAYEARVAAWLREVAAASGDGGAGDLVRGGTR